MATDVLSAPPIADDDHPAVRFVRRAIGVGNLELRGFPADGELRLLSDTGVLVEETACASGRTAEGRIDPPTIEWSDRVAIVTIAVRPAPGNQTCPSNPTTPFTVELPGPLGWRTLLDGSHVPPAPPGTPRQPV